MVGKNKILLSLVLILCSVCGANAQMLCPFNLGFENGCEGSNTFGWTLGFTAIDSGYKAITTEEYHTKGLASAKIFTDKKTKLSDGVASFYQRIDGRFYRNKKVRFAADVMLDTIINQATMSSNINNDIYKYAAAECQLFINAKDKYGRTIVQALSNKIFLRGWNLNINTNELNVPDNTIEITFGMTFDDTINIWLDNCQLILNTNNTKDYDYDYSNEPLSKIEEMFLNAFANIAGVIQYFHPSKNSIEVDWNKVYYESVLYAKQLNNFAETLSTTSLQIKDSLYKFLYPLCPVLEMYFNNEPIEAQIFKNEIHTDYDSTQFLLAFLNNATMQREVVNINGTIINYPARVMQYVSIASKWKQINITAEVKIPNCRFRNEIKMYLRYENAEGNVIAFSDIKTIDNTNGEWIKIEVNDSIYKDVTKALIIFEFKGTEHVLIDNVCANAIEVQNSIQNVILKNPSFEKELSFDLNNWLIDNTTLNYGYKIAYNNNDATQGNNSLVIYYDDNSIDFYPADTAIARFSVNIDTNQVVCEIPMYVPAKTDTLFTDSTSSIIYHTEPNVSSILETELNDLNLNWQDRTSRISNAIKLYNYVLHFTDITPQLNLNDFALCNTKKQYLTLLLKLLDDKNKRNKVWSSLDQDIDYHLPFTTDTHNNHTYIHNVLNSARPYLSEGMQIVGNPPSPTGKLNNRANFKVIDTTGDTTEMTYFYNTLPSAFNNKELYGWSKINDSIIYIDLCYYKDKEINDAFDELKKYKHWILDLRGDALCTELFISLYSDSVYKSSGRLIPSITAPFKLGMSGEPKYQFIPPSKSKHIEGKVVFLINGNSYGNSELIAASVKTQRKLYNQAGKGILIGQKTQGSMISGKGFRLDDDIFISVGVVYGYYPDGRPILNNSIEPDIEANYTPTNKYTDYILETAINYIASEK
jgi:hypothetical protein